MFKLIKGYLVPETDIHCHTVVFESLDDLAYSVSLCQMKNVAVQAGGNFGLWPNALAKSFHAVYTFEPDATNFRALCANTQTTENLFKFQAALGEVPGCVELKRNPENIGAHFVEGRGSIPVLTIDDLGLPACDLITLDIEGYELAALRGASRTLKRFHPVIHLEDKGMSEKYGVKQGEVVDYLVNSFGYAVKAKRRRDVILV